GGGGGGGGGGSGPPGGGGGLPPGGGNPPPWQEVASVLEDIIVNAESGLADPWARTHTLRIRLASYPHITSLPSLTRMRHALGRVWELRDQGLISGSSLENAQLLIQELWELVGLNPRMTGEWAW